MGRHLRRTLRAIKGSQRRLRRCIPYCAKSRPVGNVSDSAILEAGMVTALGPPRTC
jgi:hypothetical protein